MSSGARRFVVAAGLAGAAGGGWWLGLALAVYGGPAGSPRDLAAAFLAGGLLVAVARFVHLAGGRRSLAAFATLAGLAALAGPALIF